MKILDNGAFLLAQFYAKMAIEDNDGYIWMAAKAALKRAYGL